MLVLPSRRPSRLHKAPQHLGQAAEKAARAQPLSPHSLVAFRRIGILNTTPDNAFQSCIASPHTFVFFANLQTILGWASSHCWVVVRKKKVLVLWVFELFTVCLTRGKTGARVGPYLRLREAKLASKMGNIGARVAHNWCLTQGKAGAQLGKIGSRRSAKLAPNVGEIGSRSGEKLALVMSTCIVLAF